MHDQLKFVAYEWTWPDVTARRPPRRDDGFAFASPSRLTEEAVDPRLGQGKGYPPSRALRAVRILVGKFPCPTQHSVASWRVQSLQLGGIRSEHVGLPQHA